MQPHDCLNPCNTCLQTITELETRVDELFQENCKLQDLGIPNLDDCSDEERMVARNVFRHLATYAELKDFAIAGRREGKIERALVLEECCDLIYRNLPDWAKW